MYFPGQRARRDTNSARDTLQDETMDKTLTPCNKDGFGSQ
jgi:hypothetical protein